jgi:hypothetical protein
MAEAGVESFPGWRSRNLEDWATTTSGSNRAALVKAMDMGEAGAAGFPDIGELRYAMTDPRLRSTPTGSVGLTVSKFDPRPGSVKESLHSTYERGLAGSEPATFGSSVPWYIGAPDVHKGLMQAGPSVRFAERPDYYMAGRVPKGVPWTQIADQRWVDMMSEWMRRNPQGWAAPATAGGATMGGLAAQDRYAQ